MRTYWIYDTRASVYEALSCSNHALQDALMSIKLAPRQWQGYYRSARLLESQGQRDVALRMCAMALGNLSGTDDSHRCELTELRQRLEATPPPQCHISSLPVELLVTIFTLSNNPVVISHVCHQWRALAHSQPTLWRNLVLTAVKSGGGGVIQKINKWHRWSSGWIRGLHIRRSLGIALFPPGTGSYPSRMYHDIVAALRRLDLTKLKECHIQNMNPGLFLPTLGGNDVGLNNLESLSSRSEYPHYMVHVMCSARSWQSLRRLSLAGVHCNWAELSTSMCCLTSLEYMIHKDDLHGGYFRHFHQFLQANASTLDKLVVEAVVMAFGTSRFSYTPPEPIPLPHLCHLELNGVLPFHHNSFLLPSLRILRISWLKDAALVLSNLLEDGGTSFAELVEFATPGCFVEPHILSEVLLRAPKLKILRCVDFDNTVSESLSKPCTTLLRDSSTQFIDPVPLPILCPALSVLDLPWSPHLETIIKERIALAASDEGGRYQLPGLDGDQRVSGIQILRVDRCSEEGKHLWFQENVPVFSCRYHSDLRQKS